MLVGRSTQKVTAVTFRAHRTKVAWLVVDRILPRPSP